MLKGMNTIYIYNPHPLFPSVVIYIYNSMVTTMGQGGFELWLSSYSRVDNASWRYDYFFKNKEIIPLNFLVKIRQSKLV